MARQERKFDPTGMSEEQIMQKGKELGIDWRKNENRERYGIPKRTYVRRSTKAIRSQETRFDPSNYSEEQFAEVARLTKKGFTASQIVGMGELAVAQEKFAEQAKALGYKVVLE